MRSILIISVFFLYSIVCFGQEIKNVSFEPQQDKILVYYDLIGDKDEDYVVSLVLRREEYVAFQLVAKSVNGDVGEGKFAGTKKKIIWDVSKDYHIDPEVTDYYFEVKVKEISGGVPWYYYVGAAVLGGGAAAALFLGKDSETTEERQPIGAPPVRP